VGLRILAQAPGSRLSEVGNLEEAKRANRESLAVFETCGDSREQIGALSVLGWLAVVGEEYEEAASLLNDSIAHASDADAEFLSINRSNLGLVNLVLGNDGQAAHEFLESLRLSVPLGAKRIAAESLLGIAALAARNSNDADAARLRAMSLAIHDACGVAFNPAEERLEKRFLAGLGAPPHETLAKPATLEDAAKYAAEIAEPLVRNMRG
jgi:hypothetical protein